MAQLIDNTERCKLGTVSTTTKLPELEPGTDYNLDMFFTQRRYVIYPSGVKESLSSSLMKRVLHFKPQTGAYPCL